MLNAQEIRNVAFRGPLNDEIYKLAENSFLKKQLKITSTSSSAFKLMNDAEFVLRFLTLRERFETFSGKLAYEMNDFMAHNQNAKEDLIEVISKKFDRAIEYCQNIWGDNAFKRPDGNGWRDQMLAGMYDAQMLSVDAVSDRQMERALNSRRDLLRGTRLLFENDEFEKAVRTGTNTPARIKFRVQEVTNLLQAV